MSPREPLAPIAAERVMLVGGRFALIWRCPWCTTRQELFAEPPERGPLRAQAGVCRKCEKHFSVQPPEGEFEGL